MTVLLMQENFTERKDITLKSERTSAMKTRNKERILKASSDKNGPCRKNWNQISLNSMPMTLEVKRNNLEVYI